METNKKHITKSLPLLKNGSRAEDLKALSIKNHGKVILTNTSYAFNTATFLVMVALCDSEKYLNSFSYSGKDEICIEFVSTYRQRAKIIIDQQDPNIKSSEIRIDAM